MSKISRYFIIFLIVIITALVGLVFFTQQGFNKDKQDLRAKIDDKQTQINILLDEKNQYNKVYRDQATQEESLLQAQQNVLREIESYIEQINSTVNINGDRIGVLPENEDKGLEFVATQKELELELRELEDEIIDARRARQASDIVVDDIE